MLVFRVGSLQLSSASLTEGAASPHLDTGQSLCVALRRQRSHGRTMSGRQSFRRGSASGSLLRSGDILSPRLRFASSGWGPAGTWRLLAGADDPARAAWLFGQVDHDLLSGDGVENSHRSSFSPAFGHAVSPRGKRPRARSVQARRRIMCAGAREGAERLRQVRSSASRWMPVDHSGQCGTAQCERRAIIQTAWTMPGI